MKVINSDQVEGQGVGLFFPTTLKPQWINGLKARIGIFQWAFLYSFFSLQMLLLKITISTTCVEAAIAFSTLGLDHPCILPQ